MAKAIIGEVKVSVDAFVWNGKTHLYIDPAEWEIICSDGDSIILREKKKP